MKLDRITSRSKRLRRASGRREIKQALDDEFGNPGITTLAMSLLFNYPDPADDPIGNFHRYLSYLRRSKPPVPSMTSLRIHL